MARINIEDLVLRVLEEETEWKEPEESNALYEYIFCVYVNGKRMRSELIVKAETEEEAQEKADEVIAVALREESDDYYAELLETNNPDEK